MPAPLEAGDKANKAVLIRLELKGAIRSGCKGYGDRAKVANHLSGRCQGFGSGIDAPGNNGIGVRRENLHLRCGPGPLQGDHMHVVAESSVFVNGNHGDMAGAVICRQHEATAWIDER